MDRAPASPRPSSGREPGCSWPTVVHRQAGRSFRGYLWLLGDGVRFAVVDRTEVAPATVVVLLLVHLGAGMATVLAALACWSPVAGGSAGDGALDGRDQAADGVVGGGGRDPDPGRAGGVGRDRADGGHADPRRGWAAVAAQEPLDGG